MRTPEPGTAESLSGIWKALHADTPLFVLAGEVHYLRMLALAADDDLASHLLLAKLRLATVVEEKEAPARLVSMNSFLEYRLEGGEKTFAQLVHPSAQVPGFGTSVDSLLGAGLIGLSAGQRILWPSSEGSLGELHVVHVENCPGLANWLGTGGPRRCADA